MSDPKSLINGNSPLISSSLTAGFQYEKNTAAGASSVPVPTTIRGGDSVIIESGRDINAKGAQISAGYNADGTRCGGSGDIALIAGNDINLKSAEATTSHNSKSLSGGVQVNLDLSGGSFNFATGIARPKIHNLVAEFVKEPGLTGPAAAT